jgi:hypothetical protein
VSGHALTSLVDDPPGGLQQLGQVVDSAGQPPTPPPRRRIVHTTFAQLLGLRLRAAQRPFGVGQQPVSLAGGGGGQLGQLPADPKHSLRLVSVLR